MESVFFLSCVLWHRLCSVCALCSNAKSKVYKVHETITEGINTVINVFSKRVQNELFVQGVDLLTH